MHHKIIDIRNPIDFNPKLILFSCRQKTSQDTFPTNAPEIAYLPADIVKNVLIFLAPVPDLVSFSASDKRKLGLPKKKIFSLIREVAVGHCLQGLE